jgi:hypothetical protein
MSFATGFLQAFSQGMIQNKERQRQDELWNLQKKKLLADFELNKRKQEAMGEFGALLDPSLPPDQAGPVQEPMGVMEALSTPKGQRAAFTAGIADIGDIQKIQQQNMLKQMVGRQFPGMFPGTEQPTAGGQPPTPQDQPLSEMMAGGGFGGFAIDPIAAMSGEFKGVAPTFREQTMPDGSKRMLAINQVTRQVFPVGGPDGLQTAPSPLDKPIPAGDLPHFSTPSGAPPAFGTTQRDILTSQQTGASGGEITIAPEIETVTISRPGQSDAIIDRDKRTGRPIRFVSAAKDPSVSPSEAGKLASMVTGKKIAQELRDEIIGPDGKVKIDFMTAVQMQYPGVGSLAAISGDVLSSPFESFQELSEGDYKIELQGRLMRQRFADSIDAVIRARTGAAATQDEMRNMLDQFMIKPLDLAFPKIVKDKLDRLNMFMDGTLDVIKLPESVRRKINPEYNDITPLLDRGHRPNDVPVEAELLGDRAGKTVWRLPTGVLYESTNPEKRLEGSFVFDQEQEPEDSDINFSQDEREFLLQLMTPEERRVYDALGK